MFHVLIHKQFQLMSNIIAKHSLRVFICIKTGAVILSPLGKILEFIYERAFVVLIQTGSQI